MKIEINHIPGKDNPADMMTKALDWILFTKHRQRTMGHKLLVEGGSLEDPTKNPRKRQREEVTEMDVSED